MKALRTIPAVVAVLCSVLCAHADSTKRATPARVRVSSEMAEYMIVSQGQRLYRYPPEAKRLGIEGDVVLNVVISKTGAVKKITVESGNPVLVGWVVSSVKTWKYRPYMLQGKPLEFETQVQVKFRLHNE